MPPSSPKKSSESCITEASALEVGKKETRRVEGGLFKGVARKPKRRRFFSDRVWSTRPLKSDAVVGEPARQGEGEMGYRAQNTETKGTKLSKPTSLNRVGEAGQPTGDTDPLDQH